MALEQNFKNKLTGVYHPNSRVIKSIEFLEL
jgi:hypothetical protein